MEYLTKVLGVEVIYKNRRFEPLPNFMATRYRLQMVSIDGQNAVFAYPKTELERIEVLKQHITWIRKNESLPVALILDKLGSRQKEYLIREKIPFIVEGRQIYLPFMAVYLNQRCDGEDETREEMLPSSQMLLLHFIYRGAQDLFASQAAKDLELTPTSISRAAKQLEKMGLLQIKKKGVQRILHSKESPKALFQKASKKLLSPVKRTVYIPKECVEAHLLESGYPALAKYSMLNSPKFQCFASEKISQWKSVMTKRLEDSQSQTAIEMWRYDSRKLSQGPTVDKLSLALSLRKDGDERVQEAVEEMLDEFWGGMNDRGN